MPDFGDMLFVDTDAVLSDFEMSYFVGKAMKTIQRLAVEMQDIWEGYVDDVCQSDRDVLGVEIAGVGFRAHLVLLADVAEAAGD